MTRDEIIAALRDHPDGTCQAAADLLESDLAAITKAHPHALRHEWHYSAAEAGLLPCPHCGPGQSIVELHQDGIGYWQVTCGRCGSSSGILPDNEHFPDARERIVATWNKRDGVSRETSDEAVSLSRRERYLLDYSIERFLASHAAELTNALTLSEFASLRQKLAN